MNSLRFYCSWIEEPRRNSPGSPIHINVNFLSRPIEKMFRYFGLETLDFLREVIFTIAFPINICRTAVKSAPEW